MCNANVSYCYWDVGMWLASSSFLVWLFWRKSPNQWNNIKPEQPDVCHNFKCSHLFAKPVLKGTLEIYQSLLFEVLFEPKWKMSQKGQIIRHSGFNGIESSSPMAQNLPSELPRRQTHYLAKWNGHTSPTSHIVQPKYKRLICFRLAGGWGVGVLTPFDPNLFRDWSRWFTTQCAKVGCFQVCTHLPPHLSDPQAHCNHCNALT